MDLVVELRRSPSVGVGLQSGRSQSLRIAMSPPRDISARLTFKARPVILLITRASRLAVPLLSTGDNGEMGMEE